MNSQRHVSRARQIFCVAILASVSVLLSLPVFAVTSHASRKSNRIAELKSDLASLEHRLIEARREAGQRLGKLGADLSDASVLADPLAVAAMMEQACGRAATQDLEHSCHQSVEAQTETASLYRATINLSGAASAVAPAVARLAVPPLHVRSLVLRPRSGGGVIAIVEIGIYGASQTPEAQT